MNAKLRSLSIGLLIGMLTALGISAGMGPAQAATLTAAPSGQPATSRQAQLAAIGYTEQEWVLRGQAKTYSTDGDWGDDGHWRLKQRDAAQPYATRLLVRRPQDPARFNGVVVVEWLNTSLGFDVDGGWMVARDELVREGYAWVGVSAEAASVSALKKINPARYAKADVADSDLSFDIFDQAAAAIRQAAGQWGVEAPHKAAPRTSGIRLLAMGYSKSASFLFTFINAFQPLSQAFDGFYLRGATPAAIQVNGWHINIVMPKIRADLKAPVMQVQTEMEVAMSWPLSKTPDTDHVRYWEITGATHFDQAMRDDTLSASQADVLLVTPRCFNASNTLPAQAFDRAALHALRIWVDTGIAPPKAPRMQRTGMGFVKRDELGNAMGGLRLPDMDTPLVQYGMLGNFPTNSLGMWTGFACIAGGNTKPLEAGIVRARYPNEAAYRQAYKQRADKLLQDGFLLPIDHARLLKAAEAVKLPR